MLARITRGSQGLADYLRNGRKKESSFLRCDKDKIIPLYGNLNAFEKIENYLIIHETYKNNYLHITLSFSKEDTETLNKLTDTERINALQNMAKIYISHHTAGYDEEEFVAYAEVHSPIIKEENSKERLEHIHIALALYNVQDCTKLQTPFFMHGLMDNVLQTYVNKQFHLNLPIQNKRLERKKEYNTKIAKDRAFYKETLKEIKSKEELLEYFQENSVVYKEVCTKNNHYFKIITQGNIKDINLRGKEFSHLEKFMNNNNYNQANQEIKKSFVESNAEKSLAELGAILEDFHEKQFQRIYRRRSLKSKQWHNEKMKDEVIKVEKMKGEIIKSEDAQENIIETLPKVEVLPHILEVNRRLTSPVELYAHDANEKRIQEQEEKKFLIQTMKATLQAETVLEYAEKYKINRFDYEITSDNKIQKKSCRLKPKSIIDFLYKEIGLGIKESIGICTNLYEKQTIINNKTPKNEEKMNINISICKDSNVHTFVKDWEQTAVHNYEELISITKKHIYSPFIFENGYRKGENVLKSNNLLIFDFDNDTEQEITMDKIQAHIQALGIGAALLPTKSHNIEKNGKIAERFRLMIPTSSEFDCSDKELFREFQEITAEILGVYDFVDKQALRDRSKAYQKSPAHADPIIIDGRLLNIKNIFERAKKNLEIKAAKLEEEHKKIEGVRQKYKKPEYSMNSKTLTYLNINKAYEIPIQDLIMHFEPDSNVLTEGKYIYLKNTRAKYSILPEMNLAYDFKSDSTFNVISYMASQINSDSLYHIGYEIKQIMGIDCFEVNVNALRENIKNILTFAKNDKELENNLKTVFGVKACKLDKNVLKIANQTILLSDLGFSKLEIINTFKENRKNNNDLTMSM